MKYRKKPVVIEAIQWNGINLEEIREFVGEDLCYIINDATWEVGKGRPYVHMEIKTLEGMHIVTEGDYILKGVHGEFYPCKPDIFAKTYDEVDDSMTFGLAIEAMKKGDKVARKGWNGKGMFVYLQKGSTMYSGDARNEILAKMEGKITINSHIDMKAADGTIVIGWLASQTDMLAEDWFVIEHER